MTSTNPINNERLSNVSDVSKFLSPDEQEKQVLRSDKSATSTSQNFNEPQKYDHIEMSRPQLFLDSSKVRASQSTKTEEKGTNEREFQSFFKSNMERYLKVNEAVLTRDVIVAIVEAMNAGREPPQSISNHFKIVTEITVEMIKQKNELPEVISHIKSEKHETSPQFSSKFVDAIGQTQQISYEVLLDNIINLAVSIERAADSLLSKMDKSHPSYSAIAGINSSLETSNTKRVLGGPSSVQPPPKKTLSEMMISLGSMIAQQSLLALKLGESKLNEKEINVQERKKNEEEIEKLNVAIREQKAEITQRNKENKIIAPILAVVGILFTVVVGIAFSVAVIPLLVGIGIGCVGLLISIFNALDNTESLTKATEWVNEKFNEVFNTVYGSWAPVWVREIAKAHFVISVAATMALVAVLLGQGANAASIIVQIGSEMGKQATIGLTGLLIATTPVFVKGIENIIDARDDLSSEAKDQHKIWGTVLVTAAQLIGAFGFTLASAKIAATSANQKTVGDIIPAFKNLDARLGLMGMFIKVAEKGVLPAVSGGSQMGIQIRKAMSHEKIAGLLNIKGGYDSLASIIEETSIWLSDLIIKFQEDTASSEESRVGIMKLQTRHVKGVSQMMSRLTA